TLDDVDAMLTAAPGPQATRAQPVPAAALPAPAVPALPVPAPGPAPAPPRPPQVRGVTGWPPRKRNALVYGCFALGVLFVLFATALDSEHPLLIVLSVLVLPFVAWLAAIVTILVLFRDSPTGRSTTPKMGLLICLAPNLLLCCGLVGIAGAQLLS